MEYCYPYPHPAVTTDIVIFGIIEDYLNVLLIKRGDQPFKDQWALPGGFVEPDEDLDQCARRELEEETGLADVYLEQLYTFGQPLRDPRDRVISVSYFALISDQATSSIKAGSDASDASWFKVDTLPPLAFDHTEIVTMARERLVAKLQYSTIAFQLLPEKFTLTELQSVYETILGHPIDKRNFRKQILHLDNLQKTGEKKRNGAHRPAALYQLKQRNKIDWIR